EILRSRLRTTDTVLDIGAGGGRYALPLALECQAVIALDPSEGMRNVLRSSMDEYAIANVQIVAGRWPVDMDPVDVALISHLGYDVEDIGPFLDAMERVAQRLCIAVLLERPPPTEAARLVP